MLIKKLLISPMHTDNKHTSNYPFVFFVFHIRNPTSPLLASSGLGGGASSTGTWEPVAGPLVRQLRRDWGTWKISSEKVLETARSAVAQRAEGMGGC